MRALALALALASSSAHAGELYATVSTWSLHLGRQPTNERTFGAGLGYQVLPEKLDVMAGYFENSQWRRSRYAVAAWWVDEHLFIAAGYLDGYPDGRAPLGFALVGAFGPARIVAAPGSFSLWLALPLRAFE